MRVLITGASGFIGRALTQALSERNIEVRAAARNLSAIPTGPGIEPVSLPDLSQPVDWRPLLAGADVVVHLAGIAHVPEGTTTDESYDRANRLATKELALACSMSSTIERLIFVSSVRAQTGPSAESIQTEADAPHPIDAYGRSKLAAEGFVRGYGTPFTILRPVVVFGPEQRANMAQLTKLASLPFPLPFGGFANRRSLLALDNMISAIIFSMNSTATEGETYIVSDPSALSIAEVIETLRKAAGRSPSLLPVPPTWMESILRAAGKTDIWARIGTSLVADSTKLRAAGWQPPTDTPQALAALVTQPRP